MLKKLFVRLGLSKAPSPIRRFLGAKMFLGTIPALAYLGWRNRHRLRGALERRRHASAHATG